jgi:hypothetical protein
MICGGSKQVALPGESGKERTTRAQAGKMLCVSETIFPFSSRHSMSMVYGGIAADGGLQPTPEVRMMGGEFVDLRGPARLGGSKSAKVRVEKE